MADNERKLWQGVKRLAQILLMVSAFLLLILGIGWSIIRADHTYVVEKIKQAALEEWNAEIHLEGYRLQWVKPYSLLRLQLRGLRLAAADHSTYPLLVVNHAVSEFNPWDMLTGDLQASSLLIDSLWIHLYKDSLQNSNYRFSDREKVSRKAGNLDIDLKSFPAVTVNYLDFHHQDEHRDKWQQVQFSQLQMQTLPDDQGRWALLLNSHCHFDGLVFKKSAGGFLMNTDARLALEMTLTDRGRTLQLRNTTLSVGRDEFSLQGQFQWADTNRLVLQIGTTGSLMPDVLPLLSDKVNSALCDIQVDQPIRAHFTLTEAIIPGRKEAIEVAFSTDEAQVQYKGVNMSSVTVVGSYSNDCDGDGVGEEATSCITFQQLDGDIFSVLPARLQGVITNMVDPRVNASGRLELELPRLNTLLTAKDKFTFTTGSAIVNFRYDGELENVLDAPFDEQNIRAQGDAVFDNVTIATGRPDLLLPSLSGHISFNEEQTSLDDICLEWKGANMQISGQLRNLPEFVFYDDQTLLSDLRLHIDRLNLNHLNDTFSAKENVKKRQPASDSSLENLSRKLANNLNGRVLLEIDKLTYDTLFLADLSAELRLFSLRRPEFADSSLIRLEQIQGSFMGHTPVYADLTVSREASPVASLQIDIPSAMRLAGFVLQQGVRITAGQADLSLSARLPLRSLSRSGSWQSDLHLQGLAQFQKVDLVASALARPIRRMSGPLVFDHNSLRFDDLQFQYNGSPFTLGGQIHYRPLSQQDGAAKATLDLRLHGSHLDLRKKKSGTEQPVRFSPPDVFRALDTVFQVATGELHFELDSLIADEQTISPVSVHAQLLPDKHRPEQHQLQIDSFSLGFGGPDHIRGKAVFSNPEKPIVDARVAAHLQFHRLGQLLPSDYVEMKDGYLTMDLEYRSPLYDTLNARDYLLNADIDGRADLTNGEIFYNYRDFTFTDIDGQFRFDQRALYIRDLDLKINGNRLIARGQSTDFFPFFILPDRRAHILLRVESPHFDFGKFTAPHALGKDQLTAGRKKTTAATPGDTAQTTLRQTAGYIDQLLDRGSLEMSTYLDAVVYEEFIAHEVDGRVSLAPDTVQLHKLRMDVANGTFTIAGLISNIIYHEPRMEVAIEMDKNDVREIFRQFNDFGQNDLSYDNVNGRISADLTFRADINSNYDILPETMHGDMNVELAGGELIDLDVFQKASGFLLRNRGLDHIFLDTLNFFAHIRGSDLYVDDFYLHSSSFDFGAMGIYSLGEDKKTRVLFSIPIRNLFRRHIPHAEMQQGDSERKGINILIDARYKKDRMRFRWKPFPCGLKKYRLPEQ